MKLAHSPRRAQLLIYILSRRVGGRGADEISTLAAPRPVANVYVRNRRGRTGGKGKREGGEGGGEEGRRDLLSWVFRFSFVLVDLLSWIFCRVFRRGIPRNCGREFPVD